MCAEPTTIKATSRPNRSRPRRIIGTEDDPRYQMAASWPRAYPVGTSTAFITVPDAISASARFASAKG